MDNKASMEKRAAEIRVEAAGWCMDNKAKAAEIIAAGWTVVQHGESFAVYRSGATVSEDGTVILRPALQHSGFKSREGAERSAEYDYDGWTWERSRPLWPSPRPRPETPPIAASALRTIIGEACRAGVLASESRDQAESYIARAVEELRGEDLGSRLRVIASDVELCHIEGKGRGGVADEVVDMLRKFRANLDPAPAELGAR